MITSQDLEDFEKPDNFFQTLAGMLLTIAFLFIAYGVGYDRMYMGNGAVWTVTAYEDVGTTASGEPTHSGVAACNWLPFGTVVSIKGIGAFTIQDRGSKRLFGNWLWHTKRIDIWMEKGAKEFGKKKRVVRILH